VARAHLVAVEALDEVAEASAAAPVQLPALELAPPRRPGWPTLAALAVACGVAAVALGVWALVAETRPDPSPSGDRAAEPSLAVLSDPGAERYVLRGSVGRIGLVVRGAGEAVLLVAGLGPAPAGTSYAAWVIPPGSAVPVGAATFQGSERVVPLTRSVPRGARVGVTLEPARVGDHPSRPLRLVAVRG
jgi:hypothetical protein